MLGNREDSSAFEQTGREAIEEVGQPGSSVSAAMSLHETPGTGMAPVCTLPSCGHVDITNQRCLSSLLRTEMALAGLLFESSLNGALSHSHT